jgi:hypothetical protein
MVCTRCDSCGAPPFVVFVAAALVGFVAAVEFLSGRSFFFACGEAPVPPAAFGSLSARRPGDAPGPPQKGAGPGRVHSLLLGCRYVACGGGVERLAPVLRLVMLTFKSFFESRARSPRV